MFLIKIAAIFRRLKSEDFYNEWWHQLKWSPTSIFYSPLSKMTKLLTKDEIEFYRENGFIKLQLFTNEEMDEMSQAYDEIFQRKKNAGMESSWKGEKMQEAAKGNQVSVLSVHNLQMHSAPFTHFLMKKKMLDALEDIMDTNNIALHHTKAHVKPPSKGAPYLMHQDYWYFPYKNDSMVAVFIHLDDTSPENGGLCVYPGSHKLGPLPDHGIVKDGQEYHWVDPERFPIEEATPIMAKRGEVVIFSYLLIHGSYLNLSDRPRRMWLLQMMDAEDEQLLQKHKSPCQGLMLRGFNAKRTATMETRFHH